MDVELWRNLNKGKSKETLFSYIAILQWQCINYQAH